MRKRIMALLLGALLCVIVFGGLSFAYEVTYKEGEALPYMGTHNGWQTTCLYGDKNGGWVAQSETMKEYGVTYTLHTSVCTEGYTHSIWLHRHKPGDWTVEQQPTCTTEGTRVRICTECPNKTIVETESIEALGHALEKVEAKAATCTTDGNIEHWKCTRDGCGKFFSDEEGTTELDNVIIPCRHTVEYIPEQSSTCEQAGNLAHYKCSVCGACFLDQSCTLPALSVTSAPLGHDLEKVEAKAATCTTPGNIAYWRCKRCNKCFVDEKGTESVDLKNTIIPAGHKLVMVTGTLATCTTAGVKEHYQCSVCQKLFSDAEGKVATTLEDVTLPAGHVLKYNSARDAGCTFPAIDQYWICIRCQKIFSDADGTTETTEEAITHYPVLGHDLVKVEAVEATCTQNGNFEYWYCQRSYCGLTFVLDATGGYVESLLPTIPAGHALEKVEAKAATCTTDGNIEHWKCTRDGCGKLFSDAAGKTETTLTNVTLSALGHNFTETNAEDTYLKSAADCTHAAVYYVSCKNCGASSMGMTGEDTFSAGVKLGHDFEGAKVEDYDDEQHRRLCKNCNGNLEAGVKYENHVAGAWSYKDGDSHVKTCVDCGHVMATGEHTYGAGVVSKMPTCWSKGEARYTCTVCGNSYTEELPALGHYFEIVTIESTCTGKGYTAKKCIRCGLIVAKDTLDPAGHNPGDWEVTKAATCTEKGQEVRTCTACGVIVEMRDIDALGHKPGDWEVTRAATCTEKGQEEKCCTVCGSVVETRDVDALGHDWGEWEVVKAPTTEAEGEEMRVCKRDPSHVETRPIAKLEPAEPENPADPETPADPENPTDPETPADPENPADPDDSDESGDSGSVDIPKTGDSRRTGYAYLMMALGISGLIALAATHRREQDN